MNLFDGATLNGLHTYKDFKLIKVGAFNWGWPQPKRFVVDIPGRDGVLDYTEAAAGEVKFNNRDAELNFAARVSSDKVEYLKTELLSAFHGVRVEAIDDADPDWVYSGLATVSFPQYNGWKLWVTISIDASPYKLARENTTIMVEPDSFDAEDITLGRGTEAQHQNTIFEFGTIADPQLDLTEFQRIMFFWPDPKMYGPPRLQIVDGDGNQYNSSAIGAIMTTINVSDITGIDKSRVYRILVQNRSKGVLQGRTTASATVTAYVDRMTVVPVWETSAEVAVLINGRKFLLPEGISQNYDCRLMQGENQISFIADSSGETISLQYQNGRL